MNQLILICGLSNSGKTTFSEKKYDAVVHCDEILFSKKSYKKSILEKVKNTSNICMEGLFISCEIRREIVNAYNGDKTICIWLDTDLEECIKRENRNRSIILIKNCYSIFEPPTYDEGWDEIYIIKNNGEPKLLHK